MNPLLKTFAHAFARSAAGVVAVYVVPIAVRQIKRAPRYYRRARYAYEVSRIEAYHRIIRWAQRKGCEAEFEADRRRQ